MNLRHAGFINPLGVAGSIDGSLDGLCYRNRVTHDVDEAICWPDRVVMMTNGRIKKIANRRN